MYERLDEVGNQQDKVHKTCKTNTEKVLDVQKYAKNNSDLLESHAKEL